MNSFLNRFNPRPPFPGGDACAECVLVGRWGVSIHAPRFREAMRIHGLRRMWDVMFQSTPPVSGRRCRQCDGPRQHGQAVSIHAPRFREAMPAKPPTKSPGSSFQSTPPVSGRRCAAGVDPIDGVRVSIHAPRFREAMLDVRISAQTSCQFQSTPPVSGRRCHRFFAALPVDLRFNPRPPFPGGDAHGGNAALAVHIVSIHAPRFREAMPERTVEPSGVQSFQSTPPVSGRRCAADALAAAGHGQFQSTPPVSGRRCTTCCRVAAALSRFNPRPPFPGGDAVAVTIAFQRSSGFNPRPPFPGGDAGQIGDENLKKPVSIHAPRFREAMPLLRSPIDLLDAFQSTPLVSGRRCALPNLPALRYLCFNPRPPFPGGDAKADKQAKPANAVSIHAPRFREAMHVLLSVFIRS